MPSIEFVDDTPPTDEDPPAGTGATDPGDLYTADPGGAGSGTPAHARLAAAVLLVGAAGLLVAASFADVYGLRYISRDDGNVQEETVDGWGRIAFRVRSGIEGQHTTRFGTALCAIAAVLVLAALIDGWPRLHGPWHARARRWTPRVVLVALGVAAGVLISATLELQAQRDNARVFSDGDIRLHQATGAFFWFGPAAVLVGACALAVPVLLRTRRRPGGEAAPEPQADWVHGRGHPA